MNLSKTRLSGLILPLFVVTILCCIPSRHLFVEDAIVPIIDVPPEHMEQKLLESPVFRAVSMRQLQSRYRECSNSSNCPDSLLQLGGLTSVEGFIVDRKNRDILLLGKKSDTLSPLLIDDLIVLLRCAAKKYVQNNMFTPPGCSIDPAAEVWAELGTIGKEYRDCGAACDNTQFQNRWSDACSKLQTVRVLGIPFQSHVASVFVEADYAMKTIVDGQDDINIPGFYDLHTLVRNEMLTSLQNGRKNSTSGLMMSRFWFCPQSYHFTENGTTTILDSCKVALLTEEQYLAQNSFASRAGVSNPLAKQVTDRFTLHYETIAKIRPVFRELKEQLKLYCVMEALVMKAAFSKAKCDVRYFTDNCSLREYSVADKLPGKSRFSPDTVMSGDGFTVSRISFVFPMCGGVLFNVALSENSFTSSHTPELSLVSKAVFTSRTGESALWWDVVNTLSTTQ